MKRVMVASVLAILAACSSPEEMRAGIGLTEAKASGAAGESAQQTLDRRMAAGAKPAEFKDEEKDGEAARDFVYSWPREVSAIPALAAQLTGPRDAALAEQRREWRAAISEFGNGTGPDACFSCVNRSYSMVWNVAADTPRFLVLSAQTFTYTGGAHGNTQFEALLWDREANRGGGAAMQPVDLFVSTGALDTAARPDFCKALITARGERLDMNIEGLDPLEDCPAIAELVVIPASADGKLFDSIQFLAAPYVVGSYAEGAYTVAIPITQALMAAVKPQYRAQFASRL